MYQINGSWLVLHQTDSAWLCVLKHFLLSQLAAPFFYQEFSYILMLMSKVNSVRNMQFELIIFDIKSFLLFFRLKTLIRPTKIILLFPEMRVTKKIFTQAAANLFFNQFFGDILFFSSFICFNRFLFFNLVCLLLFEINNVYSATHSIMWADESWKIFYPANFRKQEYFLLALYSVLHPILNSKIRCLSQENIEMMIKSNVKHDGIGGGHLQSD